MIREGELEDTICAKFCLDNFIYCKVKESEEI